MTIPPRQEEVDKPASAVGYAVKLGNDPFDVPTVIIDLIELYCEEILVDAEKRLERSLQLKYFLSRLGSTPPRGRVMTRCLLARLMFHICGRDDRVTVFFSEKARDTRKQKNLSRKTGASKSPIDQDGGDDINEEDTLGLVEGVDFFKPLIKFTPTNWEETLEMLEVTRDHLLRKDANKLVIPDHIDGWPLPKSDDEEERASTSSRETSVDAEVNESLASSSLFRKKFKGIDQAIKIQWALSLLVAEAQGKNNCTLPGVPIIEALRDPPSNQALQAYSDFIEEHFRGAPKILELLNRMLVRSDSRTRSGKLSLAKEADLVEILARREFSLSRFQDKFKTFVLDCADAVVDSAPRLLKIGFGESGGGEVSANDTGAEGVAKDPEPREDEEGVDDAPAEGNGERDEDGLPAAVMTRFHDKSRDSPEGNVVEMDADGSQGTSMGAKVMDLEVLEDSRLRLLRDVEDPLPESRAMLTSTASGNEEENAKRKSVVAKGSEKVWGEVDTSDVKATSKLPVRVRSPRLTKKRKGKRTSLNFSSSEEEDEKSGYDKPERDVDVSLGLLPPRIAIRRPPNPRGQSSSPRSRKRQKWSEDEKAAIRSGVEKFGRGNWAEIKAYYSLQLRSRTSVQIKDCFRTMLKNDEI